MTDPEAPILRARDSERRTEHISVSHYGRLARKRGVLGLSIIVAAATAYFLAARMGYALAVQPAGVSVVWFPSGLMLAALILLPRRDWLFALLGEFAGNAIADVLNHSAIGIAAFGAAANCVEVVLAAWLIIRLCGKSITLSNLREVTSLVVVAAVFSNALTACLGAFVLVWGVHMRFPEAWFDWWIGDGMGMLVVAPVILTWAALVRRWVLPRLGQLAEIVLSFAVLMFAAQFATRGTSSYAGVLIPYPYMCLPLLFWSAIRFGPAGAATATFLLVVSTIENSAGGHGAFAIAGEPAGTQVLQAYAYFSSAALSSLVPAAILSERDQATEQLRRSEERYRVVGDTATDAIITISSKSEILFANPAVETVFGYAPQDILGGDLTVLMPDYLRELHKNALVRYLETGKKHISWRGVALTALHRDGHEFPVEVSFGESTKGGQSLFTGIIRDITQRQKLEEQLSQARKMQAIGQLAGGVAHDFNNLLGVIMGYSELLTEQLSPSDPLRKPAAEIFAASERGAALTRQLLAFSRQQTLQPKILDLNEVVAHAETMLQRLIREDIVMEFAPSKEALHVKADPGQIEQVLMNLVVNSRDAMPQGGRIRVSTAAVELDEDHARAHPTMQPGRFALMEVADTGKGMDAATQARIFEPFFTTKEMGKGTGLGLATVYGVIKQSGGFIWVYSEVGRGTAFKVYLPSIQSGLVAPEALPRPQRAPIGNETVLLVEDEQSLRELARQALSSHGYNVLDAKDGADALRISRAMNVPVHMLVTDVVMPGMNGRELALTLLKERPDLKVIFVSGYANESALAGDDFKSTFEYLPKPYSPAELVRRVAESLSASGGRPHNPDETKPV